MAEISEATTETMTCLGCGGENSRDSRFCRHCGASLQVAPGQALAHNGDGFNGMVVTDHATPVDIAPVATAAPSADIASSSAPLPSGSASSLSNLSSEAFAPQAVTSQTAAPTPAAELSPQEIDARRSRQLLERATALSEKGDQTAATLACRQAIALAPGAVAGYAMLGRLLESGGENGAAMVAYRKAIELAPDSPREREGLQRLREQMQKNHTASVFRFDAQELFATTPEAGSPTPALLESTPESAAVSGSATTPPRNAGQAPSLPAPGSNSTSSVSPSALALAPSAAMTMPPMMVPPIAPRAGTSPFEPIGDLPAAPRWVRVLNGENSFYLQAAPLLVAATLSLMFLLWARGVAVSRAEQVRAIDTAAQVAPIPDQPPGTAPVTPSDAANASNSAPVSVPGTVIAPGAPPGLPPITNAPAILNASPGARVPESAPTGTNPGETSIAPRVSTQPNFPRATTRVSPPRSARAAGRTARETDTSFGGLPPARLDIPSAPALAPPVLPSVSPPPMAASSTGSSVNGAPVGSGAPGPRGYVRITGSRPGLAAAPARPENRARGDEGAARDDARAGRTGSAIDRTTAALGSGREAGWRFQQRALLRLENGDNAGAASDFQNAISAYRDQINRGVRVDDARAGINACQSGLRLAQSNARG